jgi:hypothetical protein
MFLKRKVLHKDDRIWAGARSAEGAVQLSERTVNHLGGLNLRRAAGTEETIRVHSPPSNAHVVVSASMRVQRGRAAFRLVALAGALMPFRRNMPHYDRNMLPFFARVEQLGDERLEGAEEAGRAATDYVLILHGDRNHAYVIEGFHGADYVAQVEVGQALVNAVHLSNANSVASRADVQRAVETLRENAEPVQGKRSVGVIAFYEPVDARGGGGGDDDELGERHVTVSRVVSLGSEGPRGSTEQRYTELFERDGAAQGHTLVDKWHGEYQQAARRSAGGAPPKPPNYSSIYYNGLRQTMLNAKRAVESARNGTPPGTPATKNASWNGGGGGDVADDASLLGASQLSLSSDGHAYLGELLRNGTDQTDISILGTDTDGFLSTAIDFAHQHGTPRVKAEGAGDADDAYLEMAFDTLNQMLEMLYRPKGEIEDLLGGGASWQPPP